LNVIVRSPAALAQAMAFRSYTVRSLADAVGADRSTIGHLRSGRRRNCTPEIAKRIAATVQMPLDFLFVARPSNGTQAEGRSAA
jgi:DNA-binding XRE family transcriptional regulator